MKGIIFDFNGTLFFDSDLHYKAWKVYSKKLRGKEFTDDEMRKHMFGRTNEDIIEYALGAKPDKEMLLKYAKEKEEMYRQMCISDKKRLVLAPGAINFLNYLKDNKIPRTIATMSEWDNVEFYFKEFHLSNWFDLDNIVYSDGKIPGKPAPDIYIIAADRINLKPEDCIVVEDSISGINAAKAAETGMIIAVASTENIDTLKQMSYINQIIYSFGEIDKNIFTC